MSLIFTRVLCSRLLSIGGYGRVRDCLREERTSHCCVWVTVWTAFSVCGCGSCRLCFRRVTFDIDGRLFVRGCSSVIRSEQRTAGALAECTPAIIWSSSVHDEEGRTGRRAAVKDAGATESDDEKTTQGGMGCVKPNEHGAGVGDDP